MRTERVLVLLPAYNPDAARCVQVLPAVFSQSVVAKSEMHAPVVFGAVASVAVESVPVASVVSRLRELPEMGAYSPASSLPVPVRQVSVRSVLKSAFSSSSVGSKLRLRNGARPACSPSLRVGAWRSCGVASPKLVVSPVLRSIQRAVRAKKVSRLARRLERICEQQKRQQQ